MGLGQNGCSPRSQKELAKSIVKSESARGVEGIVKNYLALVAKDYISNDVTETCRVVKKKKLKRSGEVRVDLSHCKYEILRTVIRKLGWQEALDDSRPWHLYWTDTSIGPERLLSLRPGQKVNHFFGMLQICRKKSLARHLSTMRKMFPAEYRFFPRAYILPNQLQEFLRRFNGQKLRTYILKPDSGSQGKGVALVQSVSDVKQAIGGFSGANMLAQKYLTNPMLINGYKFDLRIYTLILSCEPLRLYLYREGLVRFCTMKYMKPTRDNLRLSCMHLTNYSLNKLNPNYEYSDTEMDKGSKWSLSGLYRALAARGHDTKKLKRQIKKMVVMTFIAIAPYLVHNYKTCFNEDDDGRSCFEVLGLDVLIDDKCKPWLLEVNHSPSFSIDTPLDLKVKEALLSDTLRLIHIDPSGQSKLTMADKKNAKIRLYGKEKKEAENAGEEQEAPKESNLPRKQMEQYETEHLGNFDRIYPCEDDNLQSLYNICLSGAEEAFKHSFDMKVKKAIAKVQEERKREALEKEMEEKRRLKQRAQIRKRAQESARLVALSRQQPDLLDSDEGKDTHAVSEASQEQSTGITDDSVEMRLLQQQLKWSAASMTSSPRGKFSPRQENNSPPVAPNKKVAWESTLRNETPSSISGFCRPQIGFLPLIRPVVGCGQEDSIPRTSPRSRLSDTGRQAVVKQDRQASTGISCSFCKNHGSSASVTSVSSVRVQSSITSIEEEQVASSDLNRNSPPKGSSSRFPEVRGRNRSISPDCGLLLKTLPTARFIFDEPTPATSRTEPPKAERWHSKVQMSDVVKSLHASLPKAQGTALHVCQICKPGKRIPRYEANRSRRLRDFLNSTPAELLSCRPMEPSWKSSEALLPPKDRVTNAFATHSDPNRFLTLAKSLHRS